MAEKVQWFRGTIHVRSDDVANCAAALRAQLDQDQWQTLAALAAAVVSLWEAEKTGSMVLVVTADQAAAGVAAALRAPGLERVAEVLAR